VIRREVQALKQEGKPVVASMSSTAASGGYYIAMDADEIWASPTTLTGSIGVFAVLPTLERTLDKVGVHTDGIGTTPLAGAFDPMRSLTAEQRELLQTVVEHEYKKFVGSVAAARNKTVEEIDSVAQGRVWAGAHAKEQGLIDRLGSLREAVASAAKLGELGDDYGVDYLEPEVSWRATLATHVHAAAARLAGVIGPEVALQSVAQHLTPLELELRRLTRFAQSRAAQFYCLCTVQ
jgi:protease-4